MATFDADDFFAQLSNCEEPEQVDAAFAEIEALPPRDRKAALDRVEALFVAEWKSQAGEGTEELRMLVTELDRNKDRPQVQFLLANLEQEVPVGEALVNAQVVLNLHRLKGVTADPVVKTFVAEAAKMDDAEFSTTLGQMKLQIAVEDALSPPAKPAVRANPFRKPKP